MSSAIFFSGRREREFIIVSAMIDLYCRKHHAARETLCPSCLQLRDYAEQRLKKCKFGEGKPVCKECVVHCYSPAMREQMRQVMRWAGPRMLYTHPVYAMLHILDNHLNKNKEPVTRNDSQHTTF